MNPTAIYSKTGKGVQEASGKTSFLSRGDRAILAAIDGKMSVQQLGAKFDRAGDDKFIAILRKMDADGFMRDDSDGSPLRVIHSVVACSTAVRADSLAMAAPSPRCTRPNRPRNCMVSLIMAPARPWR